MSFRAESSKIIAGFKDFPV